MSGQILGDRYEVKQILGKKAGRRTLLACDLQTQELVVIKLLSFSNDFEWDDLKLFEREAETLKNLAHPSIPRYLNYFEINSPQQKAFALVQTYIPAKTLEHYLKSERTFTEAETKEIGKAVLEILIYLHQQNPPVVHRDIKPSNILLGDRSGNSAGQVYLVDFGSVQNVAATEGGTITIVGTYGYMPPEQFSGKTVPASDLYSLGATLIYLMTGTHPANFPQKDLRIQFEHLTNSSLAFNYWLRLMIEPSLERRLTSAFEAIQVLQRNFAPVAVQKPTGSKIKLIKDENSLKVFIPPVGFHPLFGLTSLFAIACNSFILLWTIGVMTTPFPANFILSLISLPFWGASFLMANTVLFALFLGIRLRLDRQKIALNWEIFGLKFHRPRPAPREHITKLVYIPKHSQTGFLGAKIEVPPQLTIWAGTRKYQLCGAGSSMNSEAEVQWLAHELSDWLGIPIQGE
ncbi:MULTISPECIES: serine/threonine-protein kinase [Nostoc]|uniref:Serine/threonine protein kinase n=1 Tax=Nostoc paludosum FACHB-159 TaxID=2692908 RepID=A0ABR8KEK1_9NOSO|nr:MULTISPECIES: serine/threonine-protein kinase [Nostoc]MBD2679624.1 serine/threonine protein kinase [Nostoc sp. FACHB-857]MBD2736613.1 serine/threonine protein kinase [Nostoc paludosum FACHB-159]